MKLQDLEMALSVLEDLEARQNTPHIMIGISFAKAAVKKQMPKKPYPKDKYNSGYAMHCPTCNNFICLEPDKRSIHPADESNLRCRYCGQALDWSEWQ